MFSPKKLLRIPSGYSHKWGQGGPIKNVEIKDRKNIRILFKKILLTKKIKNLSIVIENPKVYEGKLIRKDELSPDMLGKIFRKYYTVDDGIKTSFEKEQEIPEKFVIPLSVRANERRINRRFSHLLGGSYCSECGGPCTNLNHSR